MFCSPPSVSSAPNVIELNKKLEDLLMQRFGGELFRPGQERIREVFTPLIAKLKNKNLKIVTIAGTNGKGETAHTLDYFLRAKGLRTCRWTSPHIVALSERMSFQGEDIALPVLEKLIFDHQTNLTLAALSYYEFLFFIFLTWALKLEHVPDVLILEVGLGGRLDTVNLFDADLAIVTSISRDHQDILGNSYKQILLEKLAVSRRDHKLISTLALHYLREITGEYLQQRGVQWMDLFEQGWVEASMDFSLRNRILAWAASECLVTGQFPSAQAVNIARNQARTISLDLIGRGQKVTWGQALFILVGSHNPEGMRELLNSELAQQASEVVAAFSDRPERDWQAMLSMLTGKWGQHVKLVNFEHPKNVQFRKWAAHLKEQLRRELLEESLSSFLAHAKEQNKTYLITGSYYFVGHVLRALELASDSKSLGPRKF